LPPKPDTRIDPRVHRRCNRCRNRFEPQARECAKCGSDRFSWGFRIRLPQQKGSGKTRFYGFATGTEASKELRRLLGTVDDHTYVAASGRTVESYLLGEWIPSRRNSVARTTWEQQRQHMRDHVAAYFPDLPLQDLEPPQWAAHMVFLAEKGNRRTGGPLKPKTVHLIHMTLHSALKDAVKWGYLSRNVAELAGAPQLGPPQPHAIWTPDELSRFLHSEKDNRNLPYYLLVAGTALRRGEALGVRWPQLDLDRGELEIWNNLTVAGNEVIWSTTKGKRRRTLALDPLLVTVLRRHRVRQHEERLEAGPRWRDTGLVFPKQDGERQDPRTVSQYFDRACRKARLPGIGLHGLRHTYATHAITKGVPTVIVQEILGHSRASTTEDLYVHPTPQHRRAAQMEIAKELYGGFSL
jgi:integrase